MNYELGQLGEFACKEETLNGAIYFFDNYSIEVMIDFICGVCYVTDDIAHKWGEGYRYCINDEEKALVKSKFSEWFFDKQ